MGLSKKLTNFDIIYMCFFIPNKSKASSVKRQWLFHLHKKNLLLLTALYYSKFRSQCTTQYANEHFGHLINAWVFRL